MTVTVNAVGTEQHAESQSSPFSYTGLTIAAGNDIGLVVQVSVDNQTHITSPSATWNGVPMTFLGEKGGSLEAAHIYLYGIANPATGAQTFVFSWTGGLTVEILVNAIAFNGVNQGGGTLSFPNFNNNIGTVSPATVTITSPVGDMCVAAFITPTSFGTPNQTSWYIQNGLAIVAYEGQYAQGTGATAFSCTCVVTTEWIAAGVDIAASITLFAQSVM